MKSQYGSFPPKPTRPIPKTPTTKYFFRPQQPPLLPTVPPPSSFQPVNGEAEQDDDDGKKRSRLKVVATPEPNERRRGNVLQQTQIRVQTHLNVLPVELDAAGAHLEEYGLLSPLPKASTSQFEYPIQSNPYLTDRYVGFFFYDV